MESGNGVTADDDSAAAAAADGGHTLIYEDNEGDRMLVGDVPWKYVSLPSLDLFTNILY